MNIIYSATKIGFVFIFSFCFTKFVSNLIVNFSIKRIIRKKTNQEEDEELEHIKMNVTNDSIALETKYKAEFEEELRLLRG